MSNWKELVSDAAVTVKMNDDKVKALKIKIKSLQDEVSDISVVSDECKDFIIATLEDNGVDKLVYDGVTVTMGNAPWSVVIADDSDLLPPYKYAVTEFKIDKKALINNRESLGDLKGVEFVQTKKLTIKV